MNNERIEQIKKGLSGLGIQAGELYTNQEIVDSLIELQGALAKGVFEKTHAENLRDRDILIYFEALAKEYGLDQTEVFLRFKKNMIKEDFVSVLDLVPLELVRGGAGRVAEGIVCHTAGHLRDVAHAHARDGLRVRPPRLCGPFEDCAVVVEPAELHGSEKLRHRVALLPL